jgi:hypothetical protein
MTAKFKSRCGRSPDYIQGFINGKQEERKRILDIINKIPKDMSADSLTKKENYLSGYTDCQYELKKKIEAGK